MRESVELSLAFLVSGDNDFRGDFFFNFKLAFLVTGDGLVLHMRSRLVLLLWLQRDINLL